MNLTGQITVDNFIPVFTGNYSCVYKGTWNRIPVAVKVIRTTGEPNSDSGKRKVIRERTVWAAVRHRNIHPLYGFADDQAFSPFGALISPWCGNGDASQFLKRNGQQMVMAARINLWLGVLEGVGYLHGHSPCIIHGDLKPGNILIDNAGAPRICDFGLARLFLEEGSTGMTTTSEHTGTTRYLAPELVSSEDSVHPTTESDVYAVGCLGLEFIFLQKPYAKRANNLRGQVVKDLKAGVPPATTQPHQVWPSCRVWSLISAMWNFYPSDRPSAFGAVHLLRSTKFTLPEAVVRRIVDLVATSYSALDPSIYGVQWLLRTQQLRNLSLVSRAYWTYVTPVLYRNIRLYIGRVHARLPQLTYTIENSATNSLPFSMAGPSGYAGFTKLLLIGIPSAFLHPVHRDAFWMDIRTLLSKFTELSTVLIRTCPTREPVLRPTAHSLTTLEIQRVSISVIDQEPILWVLSCLQRLCLRECYPRTEQPRHPPATPRFPFTNLRELCIHGGGDGARSVEVFVDLLETFSHWVMPQLRILHVVSVFQPSPLFPIGLRNFLGTHGSMLTCLVLDIDDGLSCLTILPLCNNLRSFSGSLIRVDELYTTQAHLCIRNLETLNLKWPLSYPSNLNVYGVSMGLHVFASRAHMLDLFPNLLELKVIFSLPMPATLSLQRHDAYAIYRAGSAISKLELPSWFTEGA